MDKCRYCGSTSSLLFAKKIRTWICAECRPAMLDCTRCGWKTPIDAYTGHCVGCDTSPKRSIIVEHDLNRKPSSTILKARSRKWNTPNLP